jgi:signal transduction histidine kinase
MKRDLMGNPDALSSKEEGFLNRLPMAALAEQAVKSLRIPPNVRVSISIPPSIPAVPGRGANLLKVFTYLARNAVDAMPQGGNLTITGSAIPASRTFVVSVQDTGVGIKPEHRDQVFKPFWPTKPAGTESGLGLGLSYCRTALEAMNAEIDFDSEVGKGTKFDVSFYGFAKEEANE